MSDINFNNLSYRPKVLVAPLEWGLGHATRCIPLITHLLACNCIVLLAGDGATKSLLQAEFPSLPFLPLQGYRIKYSKKKYLLGLKLFLQIPKVLRSIIKEHNWLKNVVERHKIDAVVSDNRFGLYNRKIFSIYITHQLTIKSQSRAGQYWATKIHSFFISKYDECWVPDFKVNGIAGLLSHPNILPAHVKYIGPVTRFKQLPDVKILYDLMIIISGPEPQRTILEAILLQHLQTYIGNVLFIRGLPGKEEEIKDKYAHVCFKNHLSSEDLNLAMQQSSFIISRSGYTTLMDLIKLRKKAILIPTPGQTEQEYLGQYVMEKKMFYSVSQQQFSLSSDLQNAYVFNFNLPEIDMTAFQKTIDDFVHTLTIKHD